MVVLANHKGGVTKTTSTANLGAMFAEAGRRVLLVDCDPQANLSEAFGWSEDRPGERLARVGGHRGPAVGRLPQPAGRPRSAAIIDDMRTRDRDTVLEIVDLVLGDLRLRDRMFVARRPDPEHSDLIVIQTGEDGRHALPIPSITEPRSVEMFIVAAQAHLHDVLRAAGPALPRARPCAGAASRTRWR